MQGQTILLVEDDAAIATSLREALSEEGYLVLWTKLGEEGLRLTREQLPHLIILDVRLPDGSGFDFCRRLRQAGQRQPILMLTARQEEMDKVLGLEMGADDYVTKPYALRELLSRIRALLRRAYGELAPTAQSDQLFVGDLLVDSILSRDFPLTQATVLVIAISIVLTNLFVDILYVYIDPRLRTD